VEKTVMITPASDFIVFEHVSKSFGTRPVFQNLSFCIPRGQKVAIVGPSGSGKSTLLRVLMTLEDIQAGSIFIDRQGLWTGDERSTQAATPDGVAKIRRRVGMVFQQFNLFPHFTALRNVAEAPMRVLRLPRDEAYDRARRLLDSVGLAEKADAYPAFLSGGQQQRVAFARALAMQPDVLLLDEVTSALDPELVGEVLAVIRNLSQDGSLTILMVTHHMGFAREFADRVIFLDDGAIAEDTTPECFFDNPRHPRSREFLRAVINA
jgi:polar amino acid transport system ATP-binding protein